MECFGTYKAEHVSMTVSDSSIFHTAVVHIWCHQHTICNQ